MHKRVAPPAGRILIIHANGKEYGRGASAPAGKASNRDFSFSAADYADQINSGKPYSGDPKVNKLLPLPRPTYTEFIIRARRARMLDRLDFLYVPSDAPRPPAIDHARYGRVVWCGISFRRFTRIWTPERSHFFSVELQARALCVLSCAARLRHEPAASLGSLPAELLLDIIARSAERRDLCREEFDDLRAVCSGRRHLFLPAPGSSGLREALFDAIFGL